MAASNYTWQLDQVTFRVIEADLFEIAVDSIVNSEQTDFVLSNNEDTISGQINSRYGDDVQIELIGQMDEPVMPEGTVLKTSGGSDYKAIFHAGFHTPDQWLDKLAEDDESQYIRIISKCQRSILESLQESKVSSVAFPLIGCGIFGLSATLLAHEFAAEVCRFSKESELEYPVEIVLVIEDPELIGRVVSSAVQGIIDSTWLTQSMKTIHLGVPHLDLFMDAHKRTTHPDWQSWILCRYGELCNSYFFFNLSQIAPTKSDYSELVPVGKYLAFGTCIDLSRRISKDLNKNESRTTEWDKFLASRYEKNAAQLSAIMSINQSRNAIAHGRKVPPPEDIYAKLLDFLEPKEFRRLIRNGTTAPYDELSPWLFEADSSTGTCDIAVFDRWRKSEIEYTVPYSGLVLTQPRTLD